MSVVEIITALFLVTVFIAAEVTRIFRSRSGVIVSMDSPSFPSFFFAKVEVRLNDGTRVSASVDGCTACMGRLGVGDSVTVSRSKDGYRISLPWLRSGLKKTDHCCNQHS